MGHRGRWPGYDPEPHSLLLRPGDRFFHKIDTRHLAAPAGEAQGLIAGAATGIEDRASDLVGDGKDRRTV